MKRIAILGSTGSIGQSALAVVDAHADRLQVVGLAAGENAERLAAQIARYRPRVVAMATGARARSAAADRRVRRRRRWRARPRRAGRGRLASGRGSRAVRLVRAPTALEAVLAAIEHGKTIALANKEVLVMAGGIVTEAARAAAASRFCRSTASTTRFTSASTAARASEVRRLVLTASGGPFRGRTRV